jgi:rhodanese-related sulfurtransferase
VYCRNGQRSAHARRRLQAAGFKRVIDLGGPFYYLPCVPQIKAACKGPAIAA